MPGSGCRPPPGHQGKISFLAWLLLTEPSGLLEHVFVPDTHGCVCMHTCAYVCAHTHVSMGMTGRKESQTYFMSHVNQLKVKLPSSALFFWLPVDDPDRGDDFVVSAPLFLEALISSPNYLRNRHLCWTVM